MLNLEYIKEYSNTLSSKDCIDLLKWRDQYQQSFGNDIVVWKNECDEAEALILKTLAEKSSKAIKDYLNQYGQSDLANELELIGFGLMTQTAGVFDNLHFDTNIVYHDDAPYIRPFVCLIYLKDECEGGQLIFPAQKKIIIPEMGKMAIFPCSYMFPHQVATIAEGERVFIRLNYKVNLHQFVDQNLDQWNVHMDGIQKYD